MYYVVLDYDPALFDDVKMPAECCICLCAFDGETRIETSKALPGDVPARSARRTYPNRLTLRHVLPSYHLAKDFTCQNFLEESQLHEMCRRDH